MIGQLLDRRYRITKVLGAGAFGKTYLAEDTRRPGYPHCVVKQLCPMTNGSQSLEAARRLFHREAESLQKLGKHDRIPQLLAYFTENQQFYLVKEFTPGHAVNEEIVPGQPLSEAQVLNLLLEVLAILEFVHRHRVIHRDIKPANLIRRHSDEKLVLIDFGSVKEIGTQLAPGQMPPTVAAGTPVYMPIEQFQGNPQFNSDIYALGAIAIQALTGLPAEELPKLKDSTGQFRWHHRARVSVELARIINKMVCPNWMQRYPSAQAVVVDLQKLIARSQVPTAPPMIITQKPRSLPVWLAAWKKRSSRDWLIVAAALLLVILGLGLWGYLPHGLDAQQYLERATQKRDNGDTAGAIADYTQALKLNPEAAEVYYKRGNAYYDLQDYPAAIADYTNAIARQPTLVNAYYNRGLAQYDLGNLRDAIADFNQVIRLNPKEADAYYQRGLVYYQFSDYATAIADYNQSINLRPQDAQAYYARGLARSAAEDKQGAIADYTQAIQLNPNYADAYYSRGRSRFFLADYSGALEDYTQVIQLDPQYADAYNGRCGANLNLSRFPEAVEDCTQALERDPQDAIAYSNRCVAQLNLQVYQRAIADCTQAIQLDGNNAKAYSNRGLARAAAGDRTGAIEDYTAAIQHNPTDAVAFSNRAKAYADSGNFSKAIEDYAQAIQRHPNFASAYHHRGLVRAQFGDKQGAIEDLQKAVKLYLEQGRPHEYQAVQQQLNQLNSR